MSTQTPTTPTSQPSGFSFRPTRTQVLRFAFSLIIATLLWGWVTELNDPFTTVNYREIDIQVGPLDDSLQVVTTLPRATVTLRGPQSDINEIRRNEISVTLDTSEVDQPGAYRLPLIISTPDGPTERSVDPGELPVTIEEEVSVEMPVEISRILPEDDPRDISEIRPETTQVSVSGPSSAVERVEKVILPVTIDSQSGSFQASFTPYAVDASGQRVSEVQVLPGQINTHVEVQTRGKRISVIPIVNGVPAEGYSLQQRAAFPETIVVDGPEDELESLLFVNTEPIDITGTTESLSRQVGLANLPDDVTVIDPISGTVEVRVAIEDTSTTAQTLTGLPIQPMNLGEGLQASFSPSSVDVTVDGPDSLLTAMTPADVRIRADLGNLGPGTHEVSPEITVPQGVTWVSNTPETVEVTITGDETPASTPVGVEGSPQALVAPQAVPSTRARGKPAN